MSLKSRAARCSASVCISQDHIPGVVSLKIRAARCSASVKGAVHLHPNGRDMVCAAGGAVVVTALNDPHQQVS